MIISLCLHLTFPGHSQFFRFIPLKTGFSLSIHAKQLPPLFLTVPSDHPFLQSLIMAIGWKFTSHVNLALTSFQIALPLPLFQSKNNSHTQRNVILMYQCLFHHERYKVQGNFIVPWAIFFINRSAIHLNWQLSADIVVS